MTWALPVIIIGGTAAYWLDPSQHIPARERLTLETPYGLAAPIQVLETPGGQVGFTSRHGEGGLRHSARFVNHRANVWAAREVGARWILSWNGVGSLHPDWAVGDLVVLSDVVDFTRGRVSTFGMEGTYDALWSVTGSPFDPQARSVLLQVAQEQGAQVHARGVYACTEGPRLETTAEVRLLVGAGADVVGMTLCPEVWLARELGLRYASLGYITNHATGIEPQVLSGRQFGPVVAQTCFPLLLAAAERLRDL